MAKGAINHLDIPADDLERAKSFYAAVAGWSYESYGDEGYWLFKTGPQSGGGIGQRGSTAGDVLRIYISVDSLDEAVAAAEANGGRVKVPATDIPGMGRYAAIIDTEGNEVGLWENAPEA